MSFQIRSIAVRFEFHVRAKKSINTVSVSQLAIREMTKDVQVAGEGSAGEPGEPIFGVETGSGTTPRNWFRKPAQLPLPIDGLGNAFTTVGTSWLKLRIDYTDDAGTPQPPETVCYPLDSSPDNDITPGAQYEWQLVRTGAGTLKLIGAGTGPGPGSPCNNLRAALNGASPLQRFFLHVALVLNRC